MRAETEGSPPLAPSGGLTGTPPDQPLPRAALHLVKLDPRRPRLPAPRQNSRSSCTPAVEGVHLRFGPSLAGAAWSDAGRLPDRDSAWQGATTVKNAVILPDRARRAGSWSQGPDPSTARPGWPRESPATARSSAGCSTSPTNCRWPDVRRTITAAGEQTWADSGAAAAGGAARRRRTLLGCRTRAPPPFSDIATRCGRLGFWPRRLARGGPGTPQGAWASPRAGRGGVAGFAGRPRREEQDFNVVASAKNGDSSVTGAALAHIRWRRVRPRTYNRPDPDPATSFAERRGCSPCLRSYGADSTPRGSAQAAGYTRAREVDPVSAQVASGSPPRHRRTAPRPARQRAPPTARPRRRDVDDPAKLRRSCGRRRPALNGGSALRQGVSRHRADVGEKANTAPGGREKLRGPGGRRGREPGLPARGVGRPERGAGEHGRIDNPPVWTAPKRGQHQRSCSTNRRGR